MKPKETRFKGVLVLVLACAAVLFAAVPASAHARFLTSVPGSGSTTGEQPAEVVLTFSEAIESAFGGVEIYDGLGAVIEHGPIRFAWKQVRVALKDLEPGSYTVAFRVISEDSHPVESQFVFAYQPGAAEETAAAAPVSEFVPPLTPAPNIGLPKAAPTSSGGLWVARLVNYVSMTLIIGLLLAGTYLLKEDKERRQAFSMAVELSLVWALSAALLFALALSVVSAVGLPDALRDGLPQEFAGTRFGKATIVQTGLALAMALFAWMASRVEDKVPRRICVGISGVALLTPGIWGHAGTSKQAFIAVASDWVHLVSVTSWVGGLAILALFVLQPGSELDIGGTTKRFSKIAGVCLVLALISGTVNALMRIDSFDLLLSTQWGRLVLVKLGLFAVIAFVGYKNRSRMLPAIAANPQTGRKAFLKLTSFELVIMLFSFVAATGLASTIPADAEAASRIQSVTASFYTEGKVNLRIEPGKVGRNQMRLSFIDLEGRPLTVTRASLNLSVDLNDSEEQSLKVELVESGPGRYSISQKLDVAGTYIFTAAAEVNGSFRGAIGSFVIEE